jgi:hypothetical protein
MAASAAPAAPAAGAGAASKIPPERVMPAGSKDRLVEADPLGEKGENPLSRWADTYFAHYLSRTPVKVMLPGEEPQYLYEPIDVDTKKAFVFPPGYILLAKPPVKDGETPTFYVGPSMYAIKFKESTRKSRRARRFRRRASRRNSNRR